MIIADQYILIPNIYKSLSKNEIKNVQIKE